MTNNNNNCTATEIIDKDCFLEELMDGLLTCLEHEHDSLQTRRLTNLVEETNTFIKQERTQPVIDEESNKATATAECALRATEQYRQHHRAVCGTFVYELIQKHIYTAQYSDEWERLNGDMDDLTKQIIASNDPKELRRIICLRDSVMEEVNNFLIKAVYLGALHDTFDYPDTTDEFRCMFDNVGLNTSWEKFDIKVRR